MTTLPNDTKTCPACQAKDTMIRLLPENRRGFYWCEKCATFLIQGTDNDLRTIMESDNHLLSTRSLGMAMMMVVTVASKQVGRRENSGRDLPTKKGQNRER
jgi:Zn ribbon nucleic-acid-binding protein